MYGSITWPEYKAISSTEYTGVNEILKPRVLKKLKETLAKLNEITAAHGDDHQILPLRITRIADENIGKEKPLTFTTNTHNNYLLKELNNHSDLIYFTFDFDFNEHVDLNNTKSYNSEDIPKRKSIKLNIVDDFKDVICLFYSKKSHPKRLNWELLFDKLNEIIHNDSVKFKIGESLHFLSLIKDVFQLLMENRYIRVSGTTINQMYLIHKKMSDKDYGHEQFHQLFPQSILEYMQQVSSNFITEFDSAQERNVGMHQLCKG